MATTPDSQDTASTLTPRQRAEILIDRRIDLKLGILNQELGRQLALLQSKIDRLSANIGTLRTENNELRQNLLNLHHEYDEVREYAKNASNSAAVAKVDNRVMERTIERVNVQTEITNAFIDLLVPIYNWLTTIMQKRSKLESRSYSRVDGAEIPGSSSFVEHRRRR